jgi:hypothetical protein
MLADIAACIRPYNNDIALAIVATLLVIYGDAINGFVRRLVRKRAVVIRVGVFIGLCTFGYGALTVWVVPQIARLLARLSTDMYLLVIAAAFMLLGVMAERFNRGK